MLAGRSWVAVVWLGLGLAAPVCAQTYSPPRDAYGHPDLQGTWTSRWITPLERQPGSPALALSEQEAKALEASEWKRHNAIDPIEGTDSFEFSTLVTVRGERRSSLIVDPPSGRAPYIQEAMRAGARPPTGLDGPEARAVNERCLSGGNGFAPTLTAPSGNIRQIVQTASDVMIWTELLSQLRIIPTNGRSGGGARHEVEKGRWEGDALVVETTGIVEAFRGARGSLFAVTPKTLITERFTRTGADEITYTFRVEDASLYAQPWRGETVMKRSNERMYEFACHEGNYGLANILSGARVVEQRAAKALLAKR
jgi:hypothetical protein